MRFFALFALLAQALWVRGRAPRAAPAHGPCAAAADAIAAESCTTRRDTLHVALRLEARREDFSADGFHPGPASYRRLGDRVVGVALPALRR
jgi:lysophospholipase L1-like esterase